jgi:NAD(P)-dependent dehydrogenase (short-subunit alcohol dehydrogenase family)
LVGALGGQRLDLLVNNASSVGPTPLPHVTSMTDGDLRQLFETNAIAPFAMIRETLPLLKAGGGTVVNISSDAAENAYPGWGGYGSSKAALDHGSLVIGVEQPDIRVYAFDPGDMRTEMHQAAFPGEDISDRPSPATVVPRLMQLLTIRPPSGRYTADEFTEGAVR